MQENLEEKIIPKPKKKKWKRIFFYFFLFLLAIILIPSIAINIPFVQTLVVKQVSSILSKKLTTTVTVESVNIRFFNRMRLNGVFVEDINKDTLMYVAHLDANVSKLPFRGNTFTVSNLKLSNGVFTLRSDSIATNITQILSNIINKEKDTTKAGVKLKLNTESFILEDFRYNMFLYNGLSVEEQPEGIIYKNMSVYDININADRITIKDDTLKFRVNKFSFKERSGLHMQQLTVDSAYIHFGYDVTLRGVRMIDEFSDIQMRNLSMKYNGGEEFKNFINNVKFDIDAHNSFISFTTLGYFAPVLSRVPATIRFNARITGPIANMRSDNFTVQSLDKTFINGRFSMSGLPDINSTIIYADLNRLTTYPKDVLTLVTGITNNDFGNFRENLAEFGDITFNGTFTGFINDFVANGYLRSELGNLRMDMKLNNANTTAGLKGNLAAINFNAGKFLKTPLLGHTNFNFMVDGKIRPGQNDISGKGVISSLVVNEYNYQNIEVEGRLVNQAFDGVVKISEPNIDLDFNGKINLAGDERFHTPIFDFDADIRHLDLVKLNVNKRDTIGIVKAKINANFMASNIFNYVGELKVSNLYYKDNTGDIDLGDITLISFNNNQRNYLELKSAFADALYYGQNDLGGFINQLEYTLYRSLPQLLAKQPQIEPYNITPRLNYSLKANVKDSRGIARVILPGLHIHEGTELNIKIDTLSQINLELNAKEIGYKNNTAANLNIKSNSINDTLNLNIAGNFYVSGINIPNLNVHNILENNTINTNLSFLDTVNNSSGNFRFGTTFRRDNSNLLFTNFDISKSELLYLSNLWNIEPTTAEINKGRFGINGFDFHRNGQHIRVSGVVSEQSTDSLIINIDNYRIQGLNLYTQPRGYNVSGIMSSEIEIRGLYGYPIIIGDLNIDTVLVNNDTLGSVVIGSMWNADEQRVDYTARIYDESSVKTSINGYLIPNTSEINLKGDIYEFNLRYLEPVLADVLSDIEGQTKGELFLKGTLRAPQLSGILTLEEAGMTVDYLKTHYLLNADIDVSNTQINITDGNIRDTKGNTGILNANFNHNNFRNIHFSANANVQNLLSLNTKEQDNPDFYGTAYATGVIGLNGNPKDFNFDITARTNTNSILYIPLNSASEAKELQFLKFVSSDSLSTEQMEEPRKKSDISVNFDLAVTPESEIQILIDPKVGDIIKAKGEGNLKINVDPSIGLFSIQGDYTIESGEYNFTLPTFSIISRKFTIDKGSRIHFNGDVNRAVLDVTASYRDRISLSTLFPEDSLASNYNVVSQILITGYMTNPTLKFNIDILNIDPEKKAQFQSFVNTEEKMTRQFLSLLVLRSFLPEQNLGNQDLGSSTIMANATDILSSQLGSLISMFNLPIDVNFDYNANSQTNAGSEFGVDISTQIFDRVILNGSASNATHSNRNFVGDFEAEVLLGKQGNTRFKVFSKSRDYFSDDMENNRNGIGISYQSQFDKFIDLFKRKKKKKKEKVEE